MLTPKIKTLVFDLGEVLIKLNFSKIMYLRRLREMHLESSLQSMNQWPLYDTFERGKITEKEFLIKLNKELAISLTLDTFRPLWNSVLQDSVFGIEQTLKQLAQNYPLWILTNSNETHINHFKINYPWHNQFQGILTSYELGCRKPEKSIYEKLISLTHSSANSILFVDDRKENIEGARACGIHAELCEDTSRDLAKILKSYSIQY